MIFREDQKPENIPQERDPLMPNEYDLNQLELKKTKLKEMADAIHAKPEEQVKDKEIAEYTKLEEEIAKKEQILSGYGFMDVEKKKAA